MPPSDARLVQVPVALLRVAHPAPLADRTVVGKATAAGAGARQVVVSAKCFPLGVLEGPGVWPLALTFALCGLALASLGSGPRPFPTSVFAAFCRLVPLGLPDLGPGLAPVLAQPLGGGSWGTVAVLVDLPLPEEVVVAELG